MFAVPKHILAFHSNKIMQKRSWAREKTDLLNYKYSQNIQDGPSGRQRNFSLNIDKNGLK